MNEIINFSVEELINKISNSQITSVEICKAYIERINKFEKDINAWAFFDKELLLEKAKESDDYKKSGKPIGQVNYLFRLHQFLQSLLVRNHIEGSRKSLMEGWIIPKVSR